MISLSSCSPPEYPLPLVLLAVLSMNHLTMFLKIALRIDNIDDKFPKQHRVFHLLAIKLKISLSENFSLGFLPHIENRSITSKEMSLKSLLGSFSFISICCNYLKTNN